jgi:hypothetical protein
MVGANKTWKEKRIEKEEQGSDVGNDRGGIGEQDVTAVNMVFQLPDEFMLLETEVAQLDLDAERAVFKKPAAIGRHMKPFYVKGHIDGVPINRLLIDGGACVNIMPSSVFKRLGHTESELMKTNMTLNGFSGEASDAKGIVAKELTIRGKMAPTSFFMVNVKGKYNALLGRDWIHANGCVPSTLHQCLIQWVGDAVQIAKANDSVCVAMAESSEDTHEGQMRCLTGQDLSTFDYISAGKSGFVPVNVKPMMVSRLENIEVQDDE